MGQVARGNVEENMYDVMGGTRTRVDVDGQHGLVELVDVMPRLAPEGKSGDYAIVQAARVSYGAGTKTVTEDDTLVRYLYRHRHTTPFEMCEVKFLCSMPIFVARQWIRHRTANVNEVSGRYSQIEDNFFVPAEDIRAQSASNKQVSEGAVSKEVSDEFQRSLRIDCDNAFSTYDRALKGGVGRELARIGLPLNTYTSWYWKIDLHNLLHFLGLRMDAHAQKEIRDYANAMFQLIAPIFPVACQAFLDYHPNMGGMLLTRQEIEAIRGAVGGQHEPSLLAGGTKREVEELHKKCDRLGLPLHLKGI